jgi:glycosyltransferase involved in cell wall biosynthesis
LRVFFAFRDAPERHAALARPKGSIERYRLFGLDEIAVHGAHVRHNLERRPPSWARTADKAINAPLYRAGGYGGDFASILPSLRTINAADVVFSTVDTVGLPLVLLKRAGLIRRPEIVYTAIGLPERLEQLRGDRMRRLYTQALRNCHAIVAYAETEADRLRHYLGRDTRVVFVPFGVDTNAFQPPENAQTPDIDVLSVGADPRRDFALLEQVAARHPQRTFRIVASHDHAKALNTPPPNLTVETDLALAQVKGRMAQARLIALPVRENSYSGATTTLLQAMAMAKPVVVSRTAAIATGYRLEDKVNCRLVEPGDVDAFDAAVHETLTGADAAEQLGIRARQTVERNLSWERYTNTLWELLAGVSAPPSARTASSR